jgi:RND family efflux transporter MFP subunit
MRRLLGFALALSAAAQTVETVRVVSKAVEQVVKLPGEFEAYERVDLHARVQGYVDRVLVDRGSVVKKGDLLAELSAPEMKTRIAEAESRVQTAESQRAEAEARLAAAQATHERLKTASATPGAIAGNELIQAGKIVDAARASVSASESSVKAARSSVQALRDLEAYLKITAPFAGVITDRTAHPGALAGPNTAPLLKLENTQRLRLLVAVPEPHVASIVRGTHVTFTVPAYPGQTFAGNVARIPRVLDPKTRTMPVELDVANAGLRLAPGMYPEVNWPVRRGARTLLVPPTAVATTTERAFVIRVTAGKAEWVDVKKGATAGDLVEVMGPLSAGDIVVKRATDEIRNGAPIATAPSPAKP